MPRKLFFIHSRAILLCLFAEQAFAAVQGTHFFTSTTAVTAFRWSSIAIAVLTAFLQGLVTSLAFMAEDSNYWTFRFRLAKVEHAWWTLVTTLLIISLILIILSFLAGNNNDSLGVLGLASASSLTIVQYLIPAWRSRHFIANRWLAWTGDSRTGVDTADAHFCGDGNTWRRLLSVVNRAKIKGVPSDWYGWHILPVIGIPEDPTDILRQAKGSKATQNVQARRAGRFSPFIFDDGSDDPQRVSLLWGREQNFRRRVSRATSSMPAGLLKSKPSTQDEYPGEGLCLAMGILGRNKGLYPKRLIFDTSHLPQGFLENNSAWEPRPTKVLRSCYSQIMDAQYGGLGKHYVQAAVELSLILMDCAPHMISAWLAAGLEHQCLPLNVAIRTAKGVTADELDAHYRSSYVSMILSLNNAKNCASHWHRNPSLIRPDLICTGIHLMVEQKPKPAWWDDPAMQKRRIEEDAALDFNWKRGALYLLGMDEKRILAGGGEEKMWCFAHTGLQGQSDSETTPEELAGTPSGPSIWTRFKRAFMPVIDHDSFELENSSRLQSDLDP